MTVVSAAAAGRPIVDLDSPFSSIGYVGQSEPSTMCTRRAARSATFFVVRHDDQREAFLVQSSRRDRGWRPTIWNPDFRSARRTAAGSGSRRARGRSRRAAARRPTAWWARNRRGELAPPARLPPARDRADRRSGCLRYTSASITFSQYGPVGQQVERLKDEPDALTAQAGPLVGRVSVVVSMPSKR